MTDANNEKVQFLLAAMRSQHWAYDLATWSEAGLTVLFYRDKTYSAGIPTSDLTGWDELTPAQKLDRATIVVVQEEERLREGGFDPTQPKPAA